jgi:hypothetical protein
MLKDYKHKFENVKFYIIFENYFKKIVDGEMRNESFTIHALAECLSRL